MSERKVLNKYIPPNFDPSKIPKLKKELNPQHTVRLMAPFSMRCNSCGEYIYKGRKFNARKETVEGERYLGIRIFRFYIRCPQCAAEITYRTDPKNIDYECEHGARRNFEPWREEKAEEERVRSRRVLAEEIDPLKALENKAFDAKRELDIAEALDEIRTLNSRLEMADADAVFERVVMDPLSITTTVSEPGPVDGEESEMERFRREQEEDDAIIKEAFQKAQKESERLLGNQIIMLSDTSLTKGPSPSTTTTAGVKRKLDSSVLGIVPRKRPSN